MRAWARGRLPKKWEAALWGDRDRWGLSPQESDPQWVEWLTTYGDFYEQNQRDGVGLRVNDAGYRVMHEVDLQDKIVLEVGPGDIRHSIHWRGQPSLVYLVDINDDMLSKGVEHLRNRGLEVKPIKAERKPIDLPLPDNSVDVIVSFYSLEHVAQLPAYLRELRRVLHPGGVLVGAIPTEGSLAWGGGRMLTSRRWFLKNTSIDPDKIICWEHPNFGDAVIDALDSEFNRVNVTTWPFSRAPFDANLVIKFVYRKSDSVTANP